MKINDILSGSRVLGLFWTCVFLGSCTVVQNYDSGVNNFFTIQGSIPEKFGEIKGEHCGEFRRQIRIDHVRPMLPSVDITKLTPEEVNDVLLTYTEQLKKYVINEEKYLNEDVLRHRETCQGTPAEFLKMDSTNQMGEEQHNTNKVQ